MIPFKNTENRFGLGPIALHWVMAGLMIAAFVVGQMMEDMPKGPELFKLIGIHKMLGVAILTLVVVRLAWRFTDRPPAVPGTPSAFEKLGHKLVLIGLYGAMIGLPMSGWAMASTGGHPVSFFGLFDLPAILPKDKALHETFEEVHEALVPVLVASFAIHILATLKHKIVDKDGVLERMLPWKP